MSEVVKEKDEQAKAVLESCFPDRKVIMIDSLALNPVSYTHLIKRGEGVLNLPNGN